MPLPLVLGGLGAVAGSSTAVHTAAGVGGVGAADAASKGAQAASVGSDAAKVRTCTGLIGAGVSWETLSAIGTNVGSVIGVGMVAVTLKELWKSNAGIQDPRATPGRKRVPEKAASSGST